MIWRAIRGLGRVLVLGYLCLGAMPVEASALLLSETEVTQILKHGPWPVRTAPDPSNHVSGHEAAVALGRTLFFDTRLSGAGTIACGTCHRPDLGWTDGLVRARGIRPLDRNTMPLYNLARNRWFGWDGRSDSLWAHSIGPILDPREMAADPAHIAGLMAGDPVLSAAYRAVFGKSVDLGDPSRVLVDAAKALAAFQETIVSGPTTFDAFRDALDRGDRAAAARFPPAARRGAALFVGRGKCNVCHLGPGFTNGEFADAGVPYFIAPGRVDPGRHGGIVQLKQSQFNLMGRFNDDPNPDGAWATRQVAQSHANFGAFKVPTLRNLTRTAPCLHDGSRASLADVIRHYSGIDPERLHRDGETILEPLGLNETEIMDLVAFLTTLSD